MRTTTNLTTERLTFAHVLSGDSSRLREAGTQSERKALASWPPLIEVSVSRKPRYRNTRFSVLLDSDSSMRLVIVSNRFEMGLGRVRSAVISYYSVKLRLAGSSRARRRSAVSESHVAPRRPRLPHEIIDYPEMVNSGDTPEKAEGHAPAVFQCCPSLSLNGSKDSRKIEDNAAEVLSEFILHGIRLARKSILRRSGPQTRGRNRI